MSEIDYRCPTIPLEGIDPPSGMTLVEAFTTALGFITAVVSVVTFIAAGADSLVVLTVVGALVVPIVSGLMMLVKCDKLEGKSDACVAGVVDNINPEGSQNVLPLDDITSQARENAESNLHWFPFMREHPHFTLVAKCHYWPRVERNAGNILLNKKNSPYIYCYTEDSSLCTRLAWMVAMSTVGAIGGYIVGIGITQSAPFLAACVASFICVILALLIIAFAVLFFSLLGAILGDVIGRPGQVVSGEQEEPQPPDTGLPGIIQTSIFREGDIIAVRGNFTRLPWLDNARGFYFVEESFWYGRETRYSPPFDHMVPTKWLTDRIDGSDSDSGLLHWEARFCKNGLGNQRAGTCLDFKDQEIDTFLNSPTTLNNGWVLSCSDDDDMQVVGWGVPPNEKKLFIDSSEIKVDFRSVLLRVIAEVVWMGGPSVEIVAYNDTNEIGRRQSRMVDNTVQKLTIEGGVINSVVIRAQEGALVRLCVEYSV